MNNEKQEAMIYPAGRAPSDQVWNKIEKHLDQKSERKVRIPEWCYALVILCAVIAAGAVISNLFA